MRSTSSSFCSSTPSSAWSTNQTQKTFHHLRGPSLRPRCSRRISHYAHLCPFESFLCCTTTSLRPSLQHLLTRCPSTSQTCYMGNCALRMTFEVSLVKRSHELPMNCHCAGVPRKLVSILSYHTSVQPLLYFNLISSSSASGAYAAITCQDHAGYTNYSECIKLQADTTK